MNEPQKISRGEWKEIIQVPEVRESWGLEKETPEQFARMVYGVKFDYASGMAPSYVGELYVLLGDNIEEPLVLIREDKRLVAAPRTI